MPETELVERMADIYAGATMQELVDEYWQAYELPEGWQGGEESYLLNAHEREEWNVTYMDFCSRRYGHGPLRGDRVLEAGCGSGGSLPHLTKRFREVVGLDPDLPALLIAAKRLEEIGGRGGVTLVAAMLEQQILEPGSCDAVKCTDVIEHVADPVRAAEVVGSAMSYRSVAFVLTPNRWSVLTPEPHVRLWGVNLLPRRFADRYVEWRTGLRYSDIARLLSVRELVTVLRRTGADEIRVIPVEDKHLNPASERGTMFKRAFSRPPLTWLSTAARPMQPTLEVLCIRGTAGTARATGPGGTAPGRRSEMAKETADR